MSPSRTQPLAAGECSPAAAAPREVVALHGLSKTFGDQRALHAVSLTLMRGQVSALIGENGSGKSTLIKCLTGVYSPDGTGQMAWTDPRGSKACVVVHQDLGLIRGLTVAENFGITAGFARARLGRISWRQQNKRVQRIIDDAGLSINARAPIDSLTLAEQTMIAIVRLIGQAEGAVELVILDEPTAALPASERDQLLAMVRSLRERGIAILYVSHHLEEISEIADRVIVLRAGQLVHDINERGLRPAQLLTLMSEQAHVQAHESESSTRSELVLRARNIKTQLLHGMDLEVHRGEIVGLLGPLDSGATDLCRALAGSIEYEGDIEMNGRALNAEPVSTRVRRGIVLVPSDRRGHGIIAGLDVTQNLAVASLRRQFPLAPVRRKRERAEVIDVMDRFDIRPRDPHRLVGQLSGGNQQKVVLARALAQNPKLIVLENPTQGVDPAARLQIRAAIREAADRGLAVVISDVDEAEVAALAHRVIRLDRGAIFEPVQA